MDRSFVKMQRHWECIFEQIVDADKVDLGLQIE
jgi:hypothetical protein